jgi:hypothetical protein
LALALFSEHGHEQLLGDLGENAAFLIDAARLDVMVVAGSCGSRLLGRKLLAKLLLVFFPLSCSSRFV